MNTIVQTQESIVTALPSFAKSCTPHLLDWRWHVHFGDFEAICGHKVSADALRPFETMTNARIAKLREAFDIPDNYLPNEDDLWIEASNPDLEFWTLGVQEQSTYSFALREKTEPGRAKSLLELGFLRRRFVARPGRYEVADVSTTIYLDSLGTPFIIVDDDKQGYYVDADGELHSAADEGYAVMRRQYLYMIDEINAKFAGLSGQSPPAPMPRWHSLQRTKKSADQPKETTKSTLRPGASMNSSHAAQGVSNDDKGVSGHAMLFANKNNIDDATLSLEIPKNAMRIVELHNNTSILSAPWTAETVIALSAQAGLVVPDINTVDEQQWMRDWVTPAQQLIDRLADLDCTRAWQYVERHVVGMLSGPTWYATKRARKTAFTLRHVVSNWNVVENELNAAQWWPDVHIDYRGPSIFSDDIAQSSSAQPSSTEQSEQSYAQGYAAQPLPAAQVVEGSAQTLDNNEQPAQSIEVVAQVEESDAQIDEHRDDQVSSEQAANCEEAAQSDQGSDYATAMAMQILQGNAQGMKERITDTLRDHIWDEYPDISIARTQVKPGFYLVAIEVALDTWYYLGSLADWLHQSPETQDAVITAEAYARQRAASDGNGHDGGQGPPGDAWAGEEGGELR